MKVEAQEAEFSLKLAENGEVVLIAGTVRLILGSKEVACGELRRFLAEIDAEA